MLLELSNPKYWELQNIYVHLRDLQIDYRDLDLKSELLIHAILAISDYTKRKTKEGPRVGLPEEPIVELTKFGWIIVYPWQGNGVTNMFFSKTPLQIKFIS